MKQIKDMTKEHAEKIAQAISIHPTEKSVEVAIIKKEAMELFAGNYIGQEGKEYTTKQSDGSQKTQIDIASGDRLALLMKTLRYMYDPDATEQKKQLRALNGIMALKVKERGDPLLQDLYGWYLRLMTIRGDLNDFFDQYAIVSEKNRQQLVDKYALSSE